jgi:hypothetical protein
LQLKTLIAGRQAIVKMFYNRNRRHSTLGYSSPAHFLENWISQHVD